MQEQQQMQKKQKKSQDDEKEEDYAAVDVLERESQRVRLQAIRRMRESVREGDLNGLRAAFEGVSGYQLGLTNSHGDLEYMVLEDTLRNARLPLSVLGVFFGELGVGRYMVNPTYNVCVFSLIIQLDGGGEHIESEEEAAAWSNRLIEVVRYMVETLGMPVPHTRPFAMCPYGNLAPLLELARQSSAWASYAAFAPYASSAAAADDAAAAAATATDLLLLTQTIGKTPFAPRDAYNDYWVARLLPKATDAQLELALTQHPDDPRLALECEHRTLTRRQMRALLMMPGGAGPCRDVLGDPYLAQAIQAVAHTDCLF